MKNSFGTKTVLGAAIAAAVFLSACAPQTETDSTDTQTLQIQRTGAEPSNCEKQGASYGIVAGQDLGPGNDLSRSTVLIMILDAHDDQALCTGTLIDRHLVLTAAHCARPGNRMAVAFTNNLNCATQASDRVTRPVRAVAVHPQYAAAQGLAHASQDLAILKFEGEPPRGARVRPLPPENITPSVSSELVMAGYGISSETAQDAGVLRFTRVSAARLLSSLPAGPEPEERALPHTWLLDQAQTGVCNGDSGGPLYLRSGRSLVLIGVTSTGVSRRAGTARVCHGVSIFTDVRAHLPWIRGVIARQK